MKTIAIALAVALLASPALADEVSDQAAAREALVGFYGVHGKSNQDGVPDAKMRAQYAEYISPDLTELLTSADSAEDKYAKANPHSPPMIEGDLFSPNFEGVTSFKPGACVVKAGTILCKMLLHYADAHPRPQDRPVDWIDTVTLVKTNGGWRVDDIAYGGTWDFGNHGTLKALLKDVIADAEH